jgi:hypothetical protein
MLRLLIKVQMSLRSAEKRIRNDDYGATAVEYGLMVARQTPRHEPEHPVQQDRHQRLT